MSEARSKNIPHCPEQLDEFIHLMEVEKKYPDHFREMYWGHAKWDQNALSRKMKRHYALLVGDKALFERVSAEATFFFMDGTFRSTPHQARVLGFRGSQVICLILNLNVVKYRLNGVLDKRL